MTPRIHIQDPYPDPIQIVVVDADKCGQTIAVMELNVLGALDVASKLITAAIKRMYRSDSVG